MHPLLIDIEATLRREELLREAADRRRVAALVPRREPLRAVVGARLVRLGQRLQGATPARHAAPVTAMTTPPCP